MNVHEYKLLIFTCGDTLWTGVWGSGQISKNKTFEGKHTLSKIVCSYRKSFLKDSVDIPHRESFVFIQIPQNTQRDDFVL